MPLFNSDEGVIFLMTTMKVGELNCARHHCTIRSTSTQTENVVSQETGLFANCYYTTKLLTIANYKDDEDDRHRAVIKTELTLLTIKIFCLPAWLAGEVRSVTTGVIVK